MVLESSKIALNRLNTLKAGAKYTLATFCRNVQYGKGFPTFWNFTLMSLETRKYGITLTIRYSEIQQRILIKIGEQFIIWSGHHKVNTSILVVSEKCSTSCGEVIVQQRWPSYDSRYMHRMRRSVKFAPLAQYIEPINEEEILINYQVIGLKKG